MSTRSVSDAEAVLENELLAAARRGDEDAFRSLVEPRRVELQAHCYRMLGSVQDAEDVLQEALLRIWRGLPRFEGRSSLRVWMYRITTNACLNALGARSKRVLPLAMGPPVDGGNALVAHDTHQAWLEPYPEPPGLDDVSTAPEARYEQVESVELAFVAAMQHLPANERAVLLFREVLGFSAREMAELLETTTGAVTSTLQRARKRVNGRLPEPSQQEIERSLGDERLRALVRRYMDAMGRADVDAVVALLTEDATWSMPPVPSWYRGHEAIAGFLEREPFRFRWRHLATRASGQPAVACYAWDDESACYVARALDMLTMQGAHIAAVTAFLDPVHIERLGLPDVLPADR